MPSEPRACKTCKLVINAFFCPECGQPTHSIPKKDKE